MDAMKQGWRRILLSLLILAVLSTGVLGAMPERLVPVGSTVGIRLDAGGLLVVGFHGEDPSAAKAAGLKKGDVITAVNGVQIDDSDRLKTLLGNCRGEPLDLTVDRNGSRVSLQVTPQQENADYRLGVYLRDSISGIGTVTFYDPETGLYGALGHGVNDTESMTLLPLESGEIMPSSVVSVQRGARGAPGVLKGAFDTGTTLGTVERNTEHGIFGKSRSALSSYSVLPVADWEQIQTGEAKILANIDQKTVQEYEVEIIRLYPEEQESGRNMLLRVTDPRLLETTGGIVQGMSGSPIIQNDKLIGAVTHVLVNDPTRGYGIFIENMLDAAG